MVGNWITLHYGGPIMDDLYERAQDAIEAMKTVEGVCSFCGERKRIGMICQGIMLADRFCNCPFVFCVDCKEMSASLMSKHVCPANPPAPLAAKER